MEIITDQSILTQVSQPITPEEYHVFDLLEETLSKTENGIGLAAPQIGILKRAFVVRYFDVFVRFANPYIIYKGSWIESIEGCLSIPGRTFKTKRCEQIFVKDDLHNPMLAAGIEAIVIQHEYDHLEGLTLLQTGVVNEEDTDSQ